MPYYQSGYIGALSFDNNRVILATADPNASYTIKDISLDYDKVVNPDLADTIRSQYQGDLRIYYERALLEKFDTISMSSPVININLKQPAHSLKGVLVLFEEPPTPYARDPERFYNPKISSVDVSIAGVNNQLYDKGLKAHNLWEEARKYFGAAPFLQRRHPESAVVATDLGLSDVTLAEYLDSKFALWLDLRTSDDDRLHGTGRLLVNDKETINIRITKGVATSTKLNMYVYLIIDGELIFKKGAYYGAKY
jgi:hypothetical protein